MEEARFDSPKSPKNYVRPKVSCTLKTDGIGQVREEEKKYHVVESGW